MSRFRMLVALLLLSLPAWAWAVPKHDSNAPAIPAASSAFWVGPWASGAWFNPDRNGEGIVLQYLADGRALAIWFTYPAEGVAGEQAWLLAAEGEVDGNLLRFDSVLRPHGGRFGDAFDAASIEYEAWGSLEIEFSDCEQAVLRWQGPAAWGSGSYPMQRLSRLKEIDCAGQRALGEHGARSLAGLDSRSGAWFQPLRSGEGWMLEHLEGDQALVFWFTFDPLGEQAWLIGQGSLVGGLFEVDDVLIGGGTRFGAGFDAAEVELRSWGTLRIDFSGCAAGDLSYASTEPAFGAAQRDVVRLTTLAGSPCRDGPPPQVGSPRWVERRATATPFQSEHAATVWEDRLYVLGGFGHPRGFRRYDPAADSWTELPALPAGRDHLAAFALDGAIYMSGGASLGGGDQTHASYRFILGEQRWEPVPEIQFHYGTHAAVLHGQAYIGMSDGRLQQFDPRQRKIRVLGRFPGIDRDHSQLVAFQDEIWFIGGRTPETTHVAIYDPVSERWRAGPPLNLFRGGFAAAADDDRIVVAGGEVIAGVFYLQPSGESIVAGAQDWSLGPNLPLAVHGTAGGAVSGRFFVVSGSDVAGSVEGARGRVFEWVVD